LWSKGVEMDPDLNKYDLEHALTAHPNMTKPEWEKLYRDAWRIYYTPEHIRTILRRAKASGVNIFRLMQIILWFSQSPAIERVHPLQGGVLRMKHRSERRPSLAIEPAWRFYRDLVREFIVKQARFACHGWRLYRIYRSVAAEANDMTNTDQAMAPVADADEDNLQLFTHNKAARDAVHHARKVKALTASPA